MRTLDEIKESIELLGENYIYHGIDPIIPILNLLEEIVERLGVIESEQEKEIS